MHHLIRYHITAFSLVLALVQPTLGKTQEIDPIPGSFDFESGLNADKKTKFLNTLYGLIDFFDDSIISLNLKNPAIKNRFNFKIGTPVVGVTADIHFDSNRRVHPVPKKYLDYGSHAIQDQFRIYLASGIEAWIPMNPVVGASTSAQVTLSREYSVVRTTNNPKDAKTKRFFAKYGLPWETDKINSLERALKLPVGTGYLVNDYIDVVGSVGVYAGINLPSVLELKLDPKTEFRRYWLGSRGIFKNKDGTVDAYIEREKGISYDLVLQIKAGIFTAFRIFLYDYTRQTGHYTRSTYHFPSQSHLDSEQRTAFQDLWRQGIANPKSITPIEQIESDHMQSNHLFLYGIPRQRLAAEQIKYRENGQTPANFTHTFEVREKFYGKSRIIDYTREDQGVETVVFREELKPKVPFLHSPEKIISRWNRFLPEPISCFPTKSKLKKAPIHASLEISIDQSAFQTLKSATASQLCESHPENAGLCHKHPTHYSQNVKLWLKNIALMSRSPNTKWSLTALRAIRRIRRNPDQLKALFNLLAGTGIQATYDFQWRNRCSAQGSLGEVNQDDFNRPYESAGTHLLSPTPFDEPRILRMAKSQRNRYSWFH